MAVGEHWEWRGFGQIEATLRWRIHGLPPLSDAAWQVTDYYLWAPDCPMNIKLRGDDLKLKRFLVARDGLEQWLEDPAEVFPFPVSPTVVAQLCAEMGIAMPQPSHQWLDQPGLLALLLHSESPVRLIPVAKRRRLGWFTPAGAEQPASSVLVELTEIAAPETLTTVAVEHPQPAAVYAVLDALGLSTSGLLSLNYLQVLALWANGQRVLDRA
jgi:hypothetical protein